MRSSSRHGRCTMEHCFSRNRNLSSMRPRGRQEQIIVGSKVYFRPDLPFESPIDVFRRKCEAYFIKFNENDRQTFLSQLTAQVLTSIRCCHKRPDDMERLAQRAILKWQHGGCSYNDLSQYPAMPWVISFSTRSPRDLSSPIVCADRILPIGALNEGRLAEIPQTKTSLISTALSARPRWLLSVI
jgi:hypothetical protein